MTKLEIATAGLVVAGMGAAPVVQQHAQSKLHEENLALRQQVEESARMEAVPLPPPPSGTFVVGFSSPAALYQ